MSRVHTVDKDMLDRTRKWLLSQRDGNGGFKVNAKALDSFGRAPVDTTNAYIVWALIESGEKGLDKEVAAVKRLPLPPRTATSLLWEQTLLRPPATTREPSSSWTNLSKNREAPGMSRAPLPASRARAATLWRLRRQLLPCLHGCANRRMRLKSRRDCSGSSNRTRAAASARHNPPFLHCAPLLPMTTLTRGPKLPAGSFSASTAKRSVLLSLSQRATRGRSSCRISPIILYPASTRLRSRWKTARACLSRSASSTTACFPRVPGKHKSVFRSFLRIPRFRREMSPKPSYPSLTRAIRRSPLLWPLWESQVVWKSGTISSKNWSSPAGSMLTKSSAGKSSSTGATSRP